MQQLLQQRRGMRGGARPGGPMPGRQPMMSPDDARMPGGRAMPYRGIQQRMRGMGRPGGENRIGTGDQQGGLARALQTQTGRQPTTSRRMAFPGTR